MVFLDVSGKVFEAHYESIHRHHVFEDMALFSIWRPHGGSWEWGVFGPGPVGGATTRWGAIQGCADWLKKNGMPA